MAPLPRGMEHDDRRELYTSLPARVHYLHQFLEFSAGKHLLLTHTRKGKRLSNPSPQGLKPILPQETSPTNIPSPNPR